MRELTALGVRRATRPGRYRCGANLYLQVTPAKDGNGVVKSWLLRYVLDGKEHRMGLGSVTKFTLKEARSRARKHLQALVDGIDPLAAKRAAEVARLKEAIRRLTFKEAAGRFLDVLPEGKSAKHRAQWASTLALAYPVIGALPLAEVDTAAMLKVLLPVWQRTPETGSRLRGRCERVFAWAKAHKLYAGDNPAAWAVLRDALPKKRPVKHHKAIPFVELPAFMAELRARDTISARALEFCILTGTRTADVIGARWSEVDGNLWTVLGGRHKTGLEFEVPLSKRAMQILAGLPREGDFIFPGARKDAPLSNAAMLELLRGAAGNGFTVHGFRSTFRDWAGDKTNFPREVIEAAMSHKIRDKAEAAYRRSSALEKRRLLMEAWSSFCMSPPIAGKVLPMAPTLLRQKGGDAS